MFCKKIKKCFDLNWLGYFFYSIKENDLGNKRKVW